MVGNGSVLPMRPSSRGRSIRVLGLPISLTRAKVVDELYSLFEAKGVVIGSRGIVVVRKLSGEVHVRLIEGSDLAFGVLKLWGRDLGARVIWEAVNYRPPVRKAKLTVTPPKRFRVASWNINGLRTKRPSVVDSLLRMRLSVIALQETNVSSADWPIYISGFQVFTSDFDKSIPGARGLALAVASQYTSYLAQSSPFWVYVKIVGVEAATWHVINVYIPHDKEGRRTARASLKNQVSRIVNCNPDAKVLVLGDLNCGINRASCLFPGSLGMGLVSVKGSDKTYHKRLKWSSLDHIIASGAAMTSVGKAKVRRDVDDSDHFPVVVRIKTVLKRPPEAVGGSKRTIDKKLLLSSGNAIVNDQLWADWLNRIDLEVNDVVDMREYIDLAAEEWETVSQRLLTKNNVLVNPKPPKRSYLPRKVLRIVGLKREAWAAYLRGDEGDKAQLYREYKDAKKMATSAVSEYHSLRWVKFIQKGSESFVENNTRRFFKWVDSITKYRGVNRSAVKPIQDNNGLMCYDSESILDLWATHFEGLLVGGLHGQRNAEYWLENGGLEIQSVLPGMDDDLSWDEVCEALRSLRNFKAPGNSGLIPEFYKLMLPEEVSMEPSSPMQKVFMSLVNLIWAKGYIPDKWCLDILVTVEKPKGDLSLRDSYRGIALIEIFVKVISKCATRRITTGLESLGRIAPEQAGFREREECMGQVLTLMEVVRRRLTLGLGTIILFIDFKKAYDLVPREALLFKLRAAGVSGKTLNFLRGLYTNSKFRVRVGGTLTRIFEVLRGCRQGCVSSPISFDVFIDDLVLELRNVGVAVPSTGELLASLLFADDLAILVESVEVLKRACKIVSDWANKWEMAVGITKCGLMVPDSGGLKEEVLEALSGGEILLQGLVPPHTEEYEYLGVILTETDFLGLNRHMEDRIKKFTSRWKRLEPFLRTQSIPVKSRKHVLNVVALPVLRWGSELLGPSEKSIRKMESAYSDAIKCLVGSRSKNTIYAIESVRVELGIPSFHEIVMRGRYRILTKYPGLKSWVSRIAAAPELKHGKSSFYKTVQWFKRYPKIEGSNPHYERKLSEYFRSKHVAVKGVTVSLKKYSDARFEESTFFLTNVCSSVEFARGSTWLSRARLNAIWTAVRAAKLNLIDPGMEYKCPACESVIGGRQIIPLELCHVLFSCHAYVAHRNLLDPLLVLLPEPIDILLKLNLLLGGSVGVDPIPWSVQEWTGQGGKVLPGQKCPGFVFVAKFLDKVMPRHMEALWSFRIVDD